MREAQNTDGVDKIGDFQPVTGLESGLVKNIAVEEQLLILRTATDITALS